MCFQSMCINIESSDFHKKNIYVFWVVKSELYFLSLVNFEKVIFILFKKCLSSIKLKLNLEHFKKLKLLILPFTYE